MINFNYNNYNYALKEEDSKNLNQKSENQFNIKIAEKEINKCYNELGEYASSSMGNICSIWDNNFKEVANNFNSEHMQYCNIYGNAAAAYGNGISNGSNLEPLLENIKTSTQTAINGLKQLIVKEKQFMKKNSIENEYQYSKENGEKTDNENEKDNNKNMLDTFIATINNIFA